MSPPRVRFAPAPTGYLHVGSARAALFNWLFARHTGGTMALRIEDTDPARSRDDLIDGIQRTLHWLGLDWDGDVVRQSQRMGLYREASERLVAEERTYWCDCTREALAARAGSSNAGYDGFCRDRGLGPVSGAAMRLRTPDEGEILVDDVVRGEVRFDCAALEDFVILRADGMPTFLLANAVDDAEMGITHVIRGEDLLASTPKALLLRRALGHADDPTFAHLPLLVDEKRQKLSKRRHAVAVEEYRERGYLPEAMRNYLGLLGWAPPGDREIVPVSEMIAAFELEAVNKAGSFFDVQKLDYVNAEYLRALPIETFVRDSLPWLEEDPPWPPESFDLSAFEVLAPLVQERVRTLAEVPAMVDFIFLDQPAIDPGSWEKVSRLPAAGSVLDDAIEAFATCSWEAAVLHDVTQEVGERRGLKLAKAQAPIRVAVTGRSVGPPLFESLVVLGRERTLDRLRGARKQLDEGGPVESVS